MIWSVIISDSRSNGNNRKSDRTIREEESVREGDDSQQSSGTET